LHLVSDAYRFIMAGLAPQGGSQEVSLAPPPEGAQADAAKGPQA